MKTKSYIYQFLVFSIILAIIVSIILVNDQLRAYIDLIIYSYLGFGVLSFLTFYISTIIEKTGNNGSLLQLTFSNMIMKLMFTAVLLYIYYNVKNPVSGLFIIPFITVYIGFTIFETYFINSQAK